ncbi:B3 domain-containing transcription factor VRN1 [Striga hermonthica]|uniref:B3 domain-containing transcription factor VRN1 n=1 Tax=Striga hermonthica TaxID=68872 RepID=A0A9N7RS79_STRHE|nr:B3 domain-containing transcription factor VRN1 [Striga hermonthica]
MPNNTLPFTPQKQIKISTWVFPVYRREDTGKTPKVTAVNMSGLSKHGAPAVAVKKEACKWTENEATPDAELHKSCEAAQAEEDEIHYLPKDAQFFDVVLVKSHIGPAYAMGLPVSAASMVPSVATHFILRHRGKDWKVHFPRDSRSRPRFGTGWKNFVIDNCLKENDACVFELIDSNPREPKFKVHILRFNLPPELKELDDARGKTKDSPIVVLD